MMCRHVDRRAVQPRRSVLVDDAAGTAEDPASSRSSHAILDLACPVGGALDHRLTDAIAVVRVHEVDPAALGSGPMNSEAGWPTTAPISSLMKSLSNGGTRRVR